MNNTIAVFELALAGGLLYYASKNEVNKPIIYLTSGYLLFGAYMNFNKRVKIVQIWILQQ